jgi:hypothetical protein
MLKSLAIVCIVLLACCTVCALPVPAAVYSATFYNSLTKSVQCRIIWLTPSGATVPSKLFTIGTGRFRRIPEKIFNMGTWIARAIIDEIRCDKLVLTAPFPNVTSLELDWLFRIEPETIVSLG